MENIAKAMQIASAVLVFIIALSVSIYALTYSKNIFDSILFEEDESNYYRTISSDNNGQYSTRTVTIDTIIPSLYQYNQQNICIRIIDNSGNLIQVFDSELDVEVFNLNSKINTFPGTELTDREKYLKDTYFNSTKTAYMYGAPWNGSEEDIIARINAFLYGGEEVMINNINYKFKGGYGFLKEYEKYNFKESFITYQKTGSSLQEDGDTVDLKNTIDKTIITYQVNEKKSYTKDN